MKDESKQYILNLVLGYFRMRHLRQMMEKNTIYRFIPRTGVVVIGPDLVGRKEKISDLALKLKRNQSCHLRAPRRYGKTSILLTIKEHIEDALFIELSDVGSLTGFLKTLLKGGLANKKSHESLSQMKALESLPGRRAAACGMP